MIGKDFQQLTTGEKQIWQDWVQSSGHVLMLLPPYNSGLIDEKLDWQIKFTELVSPLESSLTQLLGSEVTQELSARKGVSERNMGHYWGASAFNTRYDKHHAASGVFAATCLPLWSISLLDKSDLLLEWFTFFEQLAGTPSQIELNATEELVQLKNIDYSIMACILAWDLTSANKLMAHQADQTFPIFQFLPSDVEAGFERLQSIGYIDTKGLTSSGLAALKDSTFWLYAEQLKERTV
ncbi:hypothetical protein [Pseudoalteromonas sp. SG43-3]|uniref:hypothetical protein n=1 Tax=Pseudoalteromonas sp. SG43-3 TaxID=2760970 RepID=UPI0015FFA3AD|nr:hypothetical protein [Pseudoalteromonas sp. SG43-3]MBB1445279.1 hypothetical protein [Pseudoalteromonas sp. SG43-3]